MAYYWAREYNNPFGLIQNPPDKWRGLEGHDKGKLIFSSNIYGARAGFINLINAYLKRGRVTPRQIMPIYAPSGHGSNDPDQYVKLIYNLSGINGNDKIDTVQKLFDFGKAITTIERGSPLNGSDLNKGFEKALVALGGQAPDFIVKGSKGSKPGGTFAIWLAIGVVGLIVAAKKLF